ncbi:MAG: GTPase Era [Gammaproteobacteria bacterium]
MNAPESIRGGFCALIGRSNVGKSTLLNRLVGMRISSTADKPQTTRQVIRGIVTSRGSQIVFVDTPGIHYNNTHLLNAAMNKGAAAALADVDAVVLVVEPERWEHEEARIIEMLTTAGKPCILCVNKIDRLRDRQSLLLILATMRERFDFAAMVPVSAARSENLDALKTEIIKLLPRCEAYIYPEDQLSDRDERSIVSELIREQLTRNLSAELPYSVYVELESFEEREGLTSIAATIWVARESQKAIVIGRSGQSLKKVGSRARAAIENLLNRRCYLSLWVKVRPGWQDDARIVGALTN